MSRDFDKRIERIEVQLCVGNDLQDREMRRRFAYNLRLVSDEALIACLLAGAGLCELPAEFKAEFERPIPVGSDLKQTRQAEDQAANGVAHMSSDRLAQVVDKEYTVAAGRYARYLSRPIASPTDLVEALVNANKLGGWRPEGIEAVTT